jgi:hypothetical protein
MAIENLSKPLILALAILCFFILLLLLLFNSFLTAFLLYIASKEKKRLSPAEKRASKMAFARRLFFQNSCAQAFFLSVLSSFSRVKSWSTS